MENTGRIRRPLSPAARKIVFGDHVEVAIREELPFYVQIDRAHLVMLLEQGLLPRESGRRLLAVMDELVAQDYAALRGRPAPRGLVDLAWRSWWRKLSNPIRSAWPARRWSVRGGLPGICDDLFGVLSGTSTI